MAIDYNSLRLKYSKHPEKLELILQEECRAKCSRKLSATLTNKDFRFPSLALAEMSSGDEAADIHAHMIEPGSKVLDMTAGLGIDVFHFASRGCRVTAIELDTHSADLLRSNSEALGLNDKVAVINTDSVEWLSTNNEHFDVIFIDPARRDTSGRHFLLSQCLPDITKCLDLLTSRCQHLIIKASPMIDISAAIHELGDRKCDVTIIGTTKECKEVVISTGSLAHGNIECITIGKGSFVVPTSICSSIYSDIPRAGQWIMQPFPAVMKAGGKVDGQKLHRNTHLYISDNRQDNTPGQQYEIIEVHAFNKRSIKDISSRYPMINVAVRNFPLSAPELAKRLKIKDGGDMMLFGVTLADDSRALLVTSMAK